MQATDAIETNVPARLDRLPWSKWHWMVVVGLGITWLLGGLEVTLAGTLVGMLKDPNLRAWDYPIPRSGSPRRRTCLAR